jgi:hypothetical protein
LYPGSTFAVVTSVGAHSKAGRKEKHGNGLEENFCLEKHKNNITDMEN